MATKPVMVTLTATEAKNLVSVLGTWLSSVSWTRGLGQETADLIDSINDIREKVEAANDD